MSPFPFPSARQLLGSSALAAVLALPLAGQAADYVIDTEDQHASIVFKISHLGFSWMYGRFNSFEGQFSWDPDQPEASTVEVTIDTTSVDTNHAERDKHLRSADLLNARKHPTARFVSRAVAQTGEGELEITGELTLNDVTRPITLNATLTGEGEDPWGNYRVGFEGQTTLRLKDFNISMDLGPQTQTVELILNVEGVRQ